MMRFIRIQNKWHLRWGIILGISGAVLLGQGNLMAQKRRKPHQPTINLGELKAKIQQHYRDYEWNEALEAWDKYRNSAQRSLLEVGEDMQLLGERIDRAQRMAQLAEPIRVIDSIHTNWERLGLDLERMLTNPNTRKNWVGFFKTELKADSSLHYSYTTQLRRTRLESVSTDTTSQMMRYERIGNQYELESDGFRSLEDPSLSSRKAFPYLMSDGLRIIFAQDRVDGLGGYDLYLSRYKVEDHSYFRPSLLGMPFNSPYNDYLLIYDEANGHTLLVSDRFCSDGALAIYRLEGAPRVLGGKNAEQNETSTSEDKPFDDALKAQISLRGISIPSARK